MHIFKKQLRHCHKVFQKVTFGPLFSDQTHLQDICLQGILFQQSLVFLRARASSDISTFQAPIFHGSLGPLIYPTQAVTRLQIDLL